MFFETIRLALRTLYANPFRTLLTMLSVTIGAFSIVVMLSLAQSGQRTLARTIEEVGGMRLILWLPNEDRALTEREKAVYDRGFTSQDLDSLRQIPYLANVSSQSTYGTETVFATADTTEQADVVGIAPGMLDILSWKVGHGRPITAEDELARNRVAVITPQLADTLYGGEAEAVGKTLFIGRRPYVVCGVLARRDLFGVHFGFSWETSVFVPQLTAEKRDGRPEAARIFAGITSDPERNESVEKLANAALLNNHRGVEDFSSLNFKGFLQQFYTFFLVLDLIVALIAGISLFAGGIGVMNIMLVSVTERTREIGIRKAVGASTRQILTQFLVEASTLAVTGGLIGIVAGLVVTFAAHQIIQHFQPTWIGVYSIWGMLGSVGTTVFIGVVFGSVPAWRAARLDIIEALRR